MTREEKRRKWEQQFIDLTDEWPFWWIDGDGALLAVIGGADLIAALDIVEKHHEQCQTIATHRAKLDSFGEVVRQRHRHIIATRDSPAANLQHPSR